MTRVRRHRARVIAIACLVVLAGLAIRFARDSIFNYDEFYFLDAAKTLALHGTYATTLDGRLTVFDPYLSTGPTVIGPVALAFRAWRPGYFVARLVMVVFFIALFLLLHRIASALHDPAAGVLSCLFVLCVPHVWFLSLHVLGEIPAVVLFLTGVQCLLWAEHPPNQTRFALLAGLFLGLAALTKLIFFLGVVALGGVALLVAIRDRRRAWSLAGGVLVSVAVLAAWELVQWLVVGPAAYLELKHDFYEVFERESGVRTLVATNLLVETLLSARTHWRALDGVTRGLSLATAGMIVVVLIELRRKIGARRSTGVHVFLSLFLASYAAWFFFAKHEPFYRLLFPAYLVAGIYLAAAVVEVARILARPIGVARKLSIGAAVGIAVIVLFIVPFVRNSVDLMTTFRTRPASRDLRTIQTLQEQVPANAQIGYWGWWRAPEVSFFLPNRFVDISLPGPRSTFVPDRDFILVTAAQRRSDPLSWEQQRRFCREEFLVLGRNIVCRFGSGLRIPVAPSPRLDFMAKDPVREDQLMDGFYQLVEPPPRWIGSPARFFIGTAGTGGRLRLAFDVPAHLGPSEANPVTVAVTVNDAVLTRVRFHTAGPKSVMTDCVTLDPTTDAARVEVATSRSFVPRKLGLNRDTRVLSLRLRDVEFHPEQSCSGAPR